MRGASRRAVRRGVARGFVHPGPLSRRQLARRRGPARRHALRLPVPPQQRNHGNLIVSLGQLLPLLAQKVAGPWRQRIEANVAKWWSTLEERAMEPAKPVNPQRVFWELSSRLPDGCILSADSGSSANWFARDLKLRRGMRASLSGTLATMGCAIPYALAAKLAHPRRVVIALLGDGAMQMNGLTELVTVADRWRDSRSRRGA